MSLGKTYIVNGAKQIMFIELLIFTQCINLCMHLFSGQCQITKRDSSKVQFWKYDFTNKISLAIWRLIASAGPCFLYLFS